MGIPKQRLSSSPPATPKDVKQRTHFFMNKLCDRDTEAMAAAELEAMAISLPQDALSAFVSAITDTRSSDKAPLRRHCLKLVSLLSRAHPTESLAPLLPRLVGSVLRRLRDQDSAVRAACVAAARDVAAAAAATEAFSSVVLKPLTEALWLEQEQTAQTGAALCLVAAVEAAVNVDSGEDGLAANLSRLIPRLVRLARSEGYKAKPAVISLMGGIVAVNGTSTSATLGILVPCLADALQSEDWAARKAAAEALTAVAAAAARRLLVDFKSTYFAFFQSRKFDKVKIVREAMTVMLEEWKDVPGGDLPGDDELGNEGDGRRLSASRSSSFAGRKERSPSTESPFIRRKASLSNEKRTSSQSLYRSPPDWKVEISMPRSPVLAAMEKDEPQSRRVAIDCGGQVEEDKGSSTGDKLSGRKILFEKNSEQRVSKVGMKKPASRVVPGLEEMNQEQTHQGEETGGEVRDGDLCLIRKQLLQIENQQMNLLDLIQRFIGSSQNGIRSLETRVQGLEMALEEISHDLVPSDGRANHCCRIPMADFLSSRFWRRTESRYSQIHEPSKSASGQPGSRDDNS